MQWPTRRQWPAVLLGVVGVVLVVGAATAVGAVVTDSPEYSHSVTEATVDDCANSGYELYDYSELPPSAQDVVDAALAAPDNTTTTDGPVEPFRYPPDPEVVNRFQYVRYEGTCYRVATDGPGSGGGALLVGLLAAVGGIVGGLGGVALVGLAAYAYRIDPRAAPPALVLLGGGAGYLLISWPSLPVIEEAALLVVLFSPAAVWLGLTRRGWAPTDDDGPVSPRLGRRILGVVFAVFVAVVAVLFGPAVLGAAVVIGAGFTAAWWYTTTTETD